MADNRISISGKEAKKHIQEALKAVFPGFKFSLSSDFDEVRVYWMDGPMVPDVEKVLNRFQSYTRILWITDGEEATGYEWKGVHYIGPRYLSSTRRLSDERRAILESYMADSGTRYLDAKVFERVDAERELIREGRLEGFQARNRPDLMLDERPVIYRRPKKSVAPLEPEIVTPAEPKISESDSSFPTEEQDGSDRAAIL